MRNWLNFNGKIDKTRFAMIVAMVVLCLILITAILLHRCFSKPNNDLSLVPPQRLCGYYSNPPQVPPPEIPPFHWQKTGLVTLWFDDEWLSQFTTAQTLMEKMGFKGALSVAVKFICHPEFMTWNELRALQEKGWETVSHSVTHHCDLEYYTPDKIQYELKESKKIIEAQGLRADHFVMPCGYGYYDILAYMAGRPYPKIVATSKQYYASYRTTDGDNLNRFPVVDRYNLKAFEPRSTTSDEQIKAMLNQAALQKGWLILVFHQIDDSNRPFALSPLQFNKILTIVKRSGLPVVLPSQALAIGYKTSVAKEKGRNGGEKT